MDLQESFDRALAHFQQGKLGEAEQICQQILYTRPDRSDVLHLLGIIFLQQKKIEKAIAYLEQAVQIDIHDPYLYFHLANAYREHGISGKAVTYYQKSIELAPHFDDAYYNLGITLEGEGNTDEAIDVYKRALQLNPEATDIWNNLGVALRKKRQLNEALNCFRKAIEFNPTYLRALFNLGITYQEMEQFNEALTYFKRVTELEPGFADAYHSMGTVCREMFQLDNAAHWYQEAIKHNPNSSEIYTNLGLVYEEKGDIDQSISSLRKAIKLNRCDPEIHWNLSLVLLSAGNLNEGWQEYEWRCLIKDFGLRRFAPPRWDGSSLRRKTIFIYAEQGIGEEIMFSSCIPEIIERGASCIVDCDKRLVPLFGRSFPEAEILDRSAIVHLSAEILRADFCSPMGSLPLFLRSNLRSFPQRNSYLVPDTKKVTMWRSRFANLGAGLKIGISWRGGSKKWDRLVRSTMLSQWDKVFSVTHLHFINLQYGDCAAELNNAKNTKGITIHDWEDADPLKDLDNFAAQIAALDLVISVDNATVHMAGALGKPVWVLLPFVCDWRWMQDFEDTPWYKTLRLIRQKTPGDWDGVFRRVVSDLKHYLETGSMPEITNSYTRACTDTPQEPVFPSLTPSSDTPYRCAVITPVGPGHENLYQECLASVENAFREKPAHCTGFIPIRIDDPQGKLGRSKARNLGIQKASEQGAEWIFFLDADDLMSPSAFEYVGPYLDKYDAVWGSIWSIESGESTARERPKQLPFLYGIEDVLSCDPFVSLQMGHFVRTPVALSVLFNESIDTGEDFDYYLRVWEKYRCIKIPLPFIYKRAF
ncbi:MAG: tetratricopeptide repeat protein [Nitrospirota bacterium]